MMQLTPPPPNTALQRTSPASPVPPLSFKTFGGHRFICVAVLILSLLLDWVSAAGASPRDASRCPALPAGSGLEWQYEEGPDFDLCYGTNVNKSAPARLIGVYLGIAPNFKGGGPMVRSGEIEGKPVRWHAKKPQDSKFKAAVETLYEVKPQIAHIWVHAVDSDTLNDLILVAEGLRFRR